MNLTTEQIREILEGAPEGATHVDYEFDYWILEDGNEPQCFYDMGGRMEGWECTPACEPLHSLSDLREILSLRQEFEGLKAQQSEVAARAVECAVRDTPTHKMKVDERLYHSQRALLEYANQLRKQGDE